MFNICKFQEYLGSSRKFIQEKLYQPKTFDVVFNGARGINRTITRLEQNGAKRLARLLGH